MARYIDAEKIPYTDLNSDMPQSKVRVYVAFKERIDRIPTADVQEVKHGKWLTTPYTDYDDAYECSVCGNLLTFIEGTPKDNGAKYCPNCGAQMEVE